MRSRKRRMSTVERAADFFDTANSLFIGRMTRAGFTDIDLAGALVNARKALLLTPNDYDTLLLTAGILGELSIFMGANMGSKTTAAAAGAVVSPDSLKEAVTLYDRALRLEPDNPEGYLSKASTLLIVGQGEAAEEMARVAWRLVFKSPEIDEKMAADACQALADSLILQNRNEEAAEILHEGLRRVHNDSMARIAENYLRSLKKR